MISWIVEQGEKKGRKPTPAQAHVLASAPDCDVGTMILVRAYAEVATCRSFGMALGPVPITAMWAWCDRQCNGAGLHPQVAAHVVRVLRLVDHEILRRQNPKGSAT